VPRRPRRLRSLAAWVRTAVLVSAVSAVLPGNAVAHPKREHERNGKTNPAHYPAKREAVNQTHQRPTGHRTAARHLPPPPAPSSIRKSDPLAPPWVIKAVAPQAAAVGIAPSLLLAVAWRESGFIPTAYGPKHGLTGYANLLKLEDGGTTAVSDRARRRVLNLRRDVWVSAAMAAETMAGERGELEDDLGRPTRPADLYFRHLLGPAGSKRFLAAVAVTPSVSSEQLLGRVARGNPIIFYRDGDALSIGEAYAKVAAMLDERMIMYGDQVRHSNLASTPNGGRRPMRHQPKYASSHVHHARWSTQAHATARGSAREAGSGDWH
jgi:hypothetical protein